MDIIDKQISLYFNRPDRLPPTRKVYFLRGFGKGIQGFHEKYVTTVGCYILIHIFETIEFVVKKIKTNNPLLYNGYHSFIKTTYKTRFIAYSSSDEFPYEKNGPVARPAAEL